MWPGWGGARGGRVGGPPRAPSATVLEYPSMTALRKVEKSDAYALSWTITASPLIVVAPHGGGIEPGTSEIAAEVAGPAHTLCRFEGKLPTGNRRMHVTSEHWDVEECLILIRQRTHALSIHGAQGASPIVYIGGLDTTKIDQLTTALRAASFVVEPAPAGMNGKSPDNFVNKDADSQGVQLELTAALRDELVAGKVITQRGRDFGAAIRSVYP